MSVFRIRVATEADLPQVQACLRETWHATYDPIFGAVEVAAISARWHALETLRANLTAQNSVFLVAAFADDIVGTASARWSDQGLVTLGRLYVSPRAQSLGLGRALLSAVIAAFDDVRRVSLEVEPRNTRAIAFYQRQGFRQVAIRAADPIGNADAAAIFEKTFECN